MRQFATRMALALAALAGWEVYARRQLARGPAIGKNYWRAYYDENTLRKGDQLRQTFRIQSTDVPIHIDVYPQPIEGAPVVIFNHGLAGYCRLFVSAALALHGRGYTVVLPDQRGQGFSGGARGDFTIAECTQNVVDVAYWAQRRYQAPLYIAGGSVGGALSCYAAAAGAPASAIACLNLFDFGNGRDGLQTSRLSALAGLPISGLMVEGFRALRPLGLLHIPLDWLARLESLMDERDAAFRALWNDDPVPPHLVTLRSIISFVSTPPATPFEENRIPALVLNQALDCMVDPLVTRRNYERLGGQKRYLEIPYGHWSGQAGFWDALWEACDSWFQAHRSVQ